MCKEKRDEIKAEDILAKIERGEDVEFEDAIVTGDLNLSKHVERDDHELESSPKQVRSAINIKNSIICESINWSNLTFQKPVNVENSIFNRNVDFTNSKFKKQTNFYQVQFKKDAYFKGTEFGRCLLNEIYMISYQSNEKSKFGNNNFNIGVSFQFARFEDDANFENSTFCCDVSFEGSKFRGDVAMFKNAKFKRDTNFGGATFQRFANFEEAEFGDIARFNTTNFRADAMFKDATFGSSLILFRARIDTISLYSKFKSDIEIDLDEANFNRIYIDWKYFKKYLKLDEAVYIALVKCLKDQGQYEDADDCYYDYREWRSRRKDLSLSAFYSDCFSWASCGYGVRLSHTIMCIIAIIAIFSPIYTGIDHPRLEYAYFSTMTFVGNIPDNFHPTGIFRIAAIIETILGYLLLPLFVVVLARKFIR